MSISSERVKKHRRKIKENMVASMGGCCQICKYNKCQSALEFHHVDPNEKDISFSKIRANNKSWEKIEKELEKCILLCANCHREVHDNIITLPLNYTKYNKDLITSFEESVKDIEPCPVCGGSKPISNVTCSKSCASKLTGKVPWHNINLEELMFKHDCNFSAIGRELDCSDNAVRKRAKILNLWL